MDLDSIRDAASDAWDWVRDVGEGVFDWLVKLAVYVGGLFGDAIGEVLDTLSDLPGLGPVRSLLDQIPSIKNAK